MVAVRVWWQMLIAGESANLEVITAQYTEGDAVTTHDNPQKKGRPTPKRREAEARRQRPLVPADRKAAKRAAREARNASFRREQEALLTGDERYMPAGHRGKVRRFIRDFADVRWSFSEFIIPVMLLFLVGLTSIAFFKPEANVASIAVTIMSGIFYGLFLISIVEAVYVWFRIKRVAATRFPDEPLPRGGWFYLYSRMVMARRWRTPAPQVTRGESLS